jgi:hypothetical protein
MITAGPLPPDALLSRYRDRGHTDCYTTDVAATVSLAEYVEAFYTGRVFRIERWLLRWLVSRPSTDAQARGVAAGRIDRFAAWDVEDRRADQLLMCDLHGRTRSWFMVAPLAGSGATRLYFGSAVVAKRDAAGEPRLGGAHSALLGFHRMYSRVLLGAARSRLLRRRSLPGAR